MTTGDRYQQYYMEAEEEKVYFFRSKREEKGTIVHQLSNLHVSSIDSQEKKVLCNSRRHHGIVLSNSQGHRKLYFLSFNMMLEGVAYILRVQGFQQRMEQYEFVKGLADNEISERWIAKHKLTGELF